MRLIYNNVITTRVLQLAQTYLQQLKVHVLQPVQMHRLKKLWHNVDVMQYEDCLWGGRLWEEKNEEEEKVHDEILLKKNESSWL